MNGRIIGAQRHSFFFIRMESRAVTTTAICFQEGLDTTHARLANQTNPCTQQKLPKAMATLAS